jgi:hypothetical protein
MSEGGRKVIWWLIAWLVLAVIAGIFVGKFIHFGTREQ